MGRGDEARAALSRWTDKGLLDAGTAESLRAELEEETRRRGRRFSRYALAVAGGIVLVIAAGVLADLLWPLLDRGTRSLVLAGTGALVHAAGTRFEARGRWLPAAWVLQTAGLLVLLGAFLHSEAAWPDVTTGGVVVGVLALAAPLLTAPRALGRNRVMPAVHLALAPAFLAVFLDRATPLTGDTITWIVDGFVLASVVLLVVELGRASRAGARIEQLDARIFAFTVALHAGLVMSVVTAAGPLDGHTGSAAAADLWWAGMTALTLWGIHRAPVALRRPWYRLQLSSSLVLAVPLVFWTCLEELDWSHGPTSLVLGLLGGAGIAYALATGFDGVLKTAALVVVLAAWYLGVEAGGAVGALVALVFTATLLLWLSTRLRDEAPDHP